MAYVLLYLLCAGIVTFVLFGIDKRKANNAKRRISENTLLRSVGLGGRIGGVLGMTYFRHKTIKSAFLRKFWVITGVRLLIVLVLLFTITG